MRLRASSLRQGHCSGHRPQPTPGSSPQTAKDDKELRVKGLAAYLRPLRRLPVLTALVLLPASPSWAQAQIYVAAGGDLQGAIDNARPGDTILLQPGATYVGNFVLPNKGGSTAFITIRSAAPDTALPGAGERVTPGYEFHLPKIRSGNVSSALRTAPGANHWRLLFLEFLANDRGYNEIISIGDGNQSSVSAIPHNIVIDRVLIRGDRLQGQKRGIGLNGAHVTIINSYVSNCMTAGQDAQAIAGWAGPGPFLIENNYLEGAGDNVLFGGADPRIHGLVPSDITFRRNHLTKPVQWMDPIIPTPANVSAVAISGGTMSAGSYGYRVVAFRQVGMDNEGRSNASQEVVVTVPGGGSSVRVTWSPVPDAAGYRVYGRSPGNQNQYWAVTTTSVTDTGSDGTSGGVPWVGTFWTVKNIFELKNARRVLIEGNVMEHNWQAAQAGPAVLFTVRNQDGGCSWCEISDVTFQFNVLRHVSAAFNILGYDYTYPSRQTKDIRIRHNLVWDVSWNGGRGGNGAFALIGDEPANVTFDHNTIQHSGNVITVYGGSGSSLRQVHGFVFTNNLAQHNDYGIFGADYGYGNSAINAYLPNSVITANTLAGGSGHLYPAGNFFPSVPQWEAEFEDYQRNDFRLKASSSYRNLGTDGKDLGADMNRVLTEASMALSGSNSGSAPPVPVPVQINTSSLPAGTANVGYAATLQASGGEGTYTWSVISGSLPPGISLGASTGALSGTPTSAGTWAFTITARDQVNTANADSKALSITVGGTPLSIPTGPLPSATVNVSYSAQLQASGGTAPYSWTIVSGVLPNGLSLNAGSGVISGSPLSSGSWNFTVQVSDSNSPQLTSSKALSIVVEQAPVTTVQVMTGSMPPANVGADYSAQLLASGGTTPYSWAVVSGALPDGLVLNTESGVLSGTPRSAASRTFTVQVSDSSSPRLNASKAFTIVVEAASATSGVRITTSSLPSGRVGNPYKATLQAAGATPFTWSLVGGALPPGLSLHAGTGEISGRPTTYGVWTFTVRVIDGMATGDSLALQIEVHPTNVPIGQIRPRIRQF
jgi:hypothetical protein